MKCTCHSPGIAIIAHGSILCFDTTGDASACVAGPLLGKGAARFAIRSPCSEECKRRVVSTKPKYAQPPKPCQASLVKNRVSPDADRCWTQSGCVDWADPAAGDDSFSVIAGPGIATCKWRCPRLAAMLPIRNQRL
jgi:hypothetical protein